MARPSTSVFVKPALTGVQFVPLFVDRKTPPFNVPAKRFVPETARAQTWLFVKPELMAAQFVPLSVDIKTPVPNVPAKRFFPPKPFGLAAKHLTSPLYGPLV